MILFFDTRVCINSKLFLFHIFISQVYHDSWGEDACSKRNAVKNNMKKNKERGIVTKEEKEKNPLPT